MCHFSNITSWLFWYSFCACAQFSACAEIMWAARGSGCRSRADCPTWGRVATLQRMCPKVKHVLWSITARSQDKLWKCCSEKTHHGGAWRACRSAFTLPKSWGERQLIRLGLSPHVGYGCRRYVSEVIHKRKKRPCIWGPSINCLKLNLLWLKTLCPGVAPNVVSV